MKRTVAILLRLALASLVCAPAALAQHLDFDGENVSGPQSLAEGGTGLDGMPLLDRFFLGFEGTDHHLWTLSVAPPIADEGGVVDYADDSDNTYGFSVGWRVLSAFGVPVRTSSAWGRCGGGSCTTDLSQHQGNNGGVFVLIGFRMTFAGGDRHIDVMSVREENDLLTVEFADKSGDDDFTWVAQFTWLPDNLVQSTTTLSGTTRGEDSASTGMSSDVVIAGFGFDFRSKDHHIQDIAVDVRSGHTVRFEYHDKNSDDEYDWVVDLVELQ